MNDTYANPGALVSADRIAGYDLDDFIKTRRPIADGSFTGRYRKAEVGWNRTTRFWH